MKILSLALHRPITRFCFASVLTAALSAFNSEAANWSAWRGPDGSGVSPEKNFPTQWSETKNIRWHVELPDRGNSSSIVWGDRVFVTQAIEKEGRRTVMCFDRVNGKLLWQQGTVYTEKEETHETNPYCAASPVTDGQRVIATFGSAGVFSYDFAGKEIWHRDLGKQSHTWGNASSPILHGNLCILYHGPGEKSLLVALDKQTGKTVWQVELPQITPKERTDGFKGRGPGIIGSFGTPILARTKNRSELILGLPEQLRAFDPATGKDLWTCDGLNPLIYTSPILGDGLVVTMGGFMGGTMAVRPGGAGDVTSTARVWHEVRAKKNRIGSGVIAGGYIYILNSDGIAECLELTTGKTVWEERLKALGAKSDSWSSMLLTGDKIYTVNQSGDTHVLRASPKFELLATNSVGEPSNSSLAASDGELFLRTHKGLWCISEKKQAAALRSSNSRATGPTVQPN
ncbi:MAG: PQQ-binding-like beta-propeller repeat protein [Verrucomicrobia bacterium]|nr:PQQ-binding-like beta-propeller repeat protein [Verrucomicrobiota bacterium]